MTSQLKTNMLRLIGISAVLFSLAGCTTTRPVSTGTAAKIKRVGVVSTTAQTFTRQYTGFTVFNNAKETIDIRDWKVDEHYEELMRAELQKSFGIDAVKAPYLVEEFEQVGKFIDFMTAPIFSSASIDIAAVVKQYCTANALDAILLLREAERGDGTTNQSYRGAVVYANGGFKKSTALYLVSYVRLLDCSTGKLIADRRLMSDQSNSAKKLLLSLATAKDPLSGIPTYFMDMKTATTPIAEWSPQTMDDIRTHLLNIANLAIPLTLRSIFGPQNTAASNGQ